MPVLSNDSVNVYPLTSRTTFTLEELRDKLALLPPDRSTFRGGWASTNNEASNMGVVNGSPPASEPELIDADGYVPKMIRARFYYWVSVMPAVASATQGQVDLRQLQGLDVVITEAQPNLFSILLSTRNITLIRRREGAVKALEAVLRSGDDTIRVDYRTSALALKDTDIFLWLAVQKDEQPQIDTEITLDLLSGISGTDASKRTADLRASVDFERPNFLTAVAETDTLGPIELSFVRQTAEGRSSFKLRLHADGGFEINKSGISYPSFMSTEALMLRASYQLAFELVPRLNELYSNDRDWPTKRIEVISQAMSTLSERYTRALDALNERLRAASE
jgi:hypothetical protein